MCVCVSKSLTITGVQLPGGAMVWVAHLRGREYEYGAINRLAAFAEDAGRGEIRPLWGLSNNNNNRNSTSHSNSNRK